MRNFFTGLGEIIAGVLGWIVLVILAIVLLGVVAVVGVAALVVISVVVVLGLIVGAVRRLFGLKPPTMPASRKGARYNVGK